MEKAFEGSWGAFINTNTADPSLEEGKREVELGETVLRAAKKAGVEVVVHSAYPLRA